VPCQTLKSLNVGAGGEALRTLPADAQFGADQGLVVSISDGTVHVRASGFAVLDEPLPAGNCSYTVQAMSDGVRATRDGTQLAQRPDLLVPQVAELVTDAQGAAATLGLSVQVHADDRYRSTPSTMTTALLIAHALSLLLLLLLAWRTWRGHRSERGLSWPRPALPDALVVAVSVVWTFLGPLNIDDSWYLLMARNAGASGYIGNYVYMFNSIENPFVLSQYAMQAWGAVGGWGLLWMRLLPCCTE
jgi:arabinosyltransferase B/arabinosyltransferase C